MSTESNQNIIPAKGLTVPPNVIALNLKGLIESTGLGRTIVYQLIKDGRLRSRKYRARRLFIVSEVEQDLKNLEMSIGPHAFDSNHTQAS